MNTVSAAMLLMLSLSACSRLPSEPEPAHSFTVSADSQTFTVRPLPESDRVEVTLPNGKTQTMDSVKGGYRSTDGCCYLSKTAMGWEWRQRAEPMP